LRESVTPKWATRPTIPPPGHHHKSKGILEQRTSRCRTARTFSVTKNKTLAAIEAGLELVDPEHDSLERRRSAADEQATAAQIRANRRVAKPVRRNPTPENLPSQQAKLPFGIARCNFPRQNFIAEDHEAGSDCGELVSIPLLRQTSTDLKQQLLQVDSREKDGRDSSSQAAQIKSTPEPVHERSTRTATTLRSCLRRECSIRRRTSYVYSIPIYLLSTLAA
jgi:hypothetical protein